MTGVWKHLSVWTIIFTQPPFLCCIIFCGPSGRAPSQSDSDCCCCKKPTASAIMECGCCPSTRDCRACCDIAYARTTPPRNDSDVLRQWLASAALVDAAGAHHDAALPSAIYEHSVEIIPVPHGRRQAGLGVWLK